MFEKSGSEAAAKLEFVVVPDLAAPNAFGPSVMDGVDRVIHTASVVPRPVGATWSVMIGLLG